ncbi:MAG: hypothetical protein DRO11_05460 [Methanobacteriota archaeon]|nr:MAG: hypothetical protein DRO11_05460 [Euryarchaeota archaeon]
MVDVGAILVGIGRLILSIIVAVFGVWLAIKMFAWFTPIDEYKELEKGNIAVGIVLGALVVAVASIIAAGVSGIVAR